MIGPARIFYVGMITTDSYGLHVGEKAFAGAAARKMTTVAHAMRCVGRRPIIVSLPYVGPMANRAFYGPVVTSDEGGPVVFLATLRSRYLRKVIGAMLLAAFASSQIRSGDTVILYNHAIEYMPALLLLKLKGVRVVQDIEDAPTAEERGLRGRLNRLSFAATFRLTAKRKMVVAEHVARGLGLDDYVVIRGVASQVRKTADLDLAKWGDLRCGGELKLHFGGTLIAETGVDLFCEAVEKLARHEDRLTRPVVFKVTGIGELNKILRLQAGIRASRKVRLELLAELSRADYGALISSCHASLSLKRPGSSISNTTFPSKVVEITASGLALVCTRFGDVVSIFNEETAFFLAEYNSSSLLDLLLGMARDPELVERVASMGRDQCNRTFSAKTVGEEMLRLL